jgi:nicotinamide-nucleotide amidase
MISVRGGGELKQERRQIRKQTTFSSVVATIAVAESCTGGWLGQALTSVPGASSIFLGGIIAYADAVKRSLLGVSKELLAGHGAVSRPVAVAMAEGVRRRFRSDIGIAITGIAGPGGGSRAKPVGLVWISLATPIQTRAWRYRFSGSRADVRRAAVLAALRHLLTASGG